MEKEEERLWGRPIKGNPLCYTSSLSWVYRQKRTFKHTQIHLIAHKHTHRSVVFVPVCGSWVQAPALVPWCWAGAPQWAAVMSPHQWPAPETPGGDTAASATPPTWTTETHSTHKSTHSLIQLTKWWLCSKMLYTRILRGNEAKDYHLTFLQVVGEDPLINSVLPLNI